VTPERILVHEWPNSAVSVEEYDGRAAVVVPGEVSTAEYVRVDVCERLIREAVREERLGGWDV
jgi:hypothetical protein